MIRPPSSCARIRIAAARAQVNVPAQVRVHDVSKSSSDIFHKTLSRSTPALVTMTSRRPNSATARSTSASAASVEPTGHDLGHAADLRAPPRVDVVDHHRGARRASASAYARPRPRAAPVTIATFPSEPHQNV